MKRVRFADESKRSADDDDESEEEQEEVVVAAESEGEHQQQQEGEEEEEEQPETETPNSDLPLFLSEEEEEEPQWQDDDEDEEEESFTTAEEDPELSHPDQPIPDDDTDEPQDDATDDSAQGSILVDDDLPAADEQQLYEPDEDDYDHLSVDSFPQLTSQHKHFTFSQSSIVSEDALPANFIVPGSPFVENLFMK